MHSEYADQRGYSVKFHVERLVSEIRLYRKLNLLARLRN